jgi:BlaI family transcriptional regulator, penicillinase repressor
MANALKPTAGELEILGVLWKRGASTVREVYAELGAGVRYTTVLKQMQVMAEKKLVARDDSERAHLYRATAPEEGTQRRIVSDMLEKAFGGSSKKLVVALLSAGKTSSEELEEIQKLIDSVKQNRKGGRS